jgi:hypothetical protein
MINFRKRPDPLSFVPAKIHTDEFQSMSLPSVTHASFGPDFNIIRAVQEYGPARVEQIRTELTKMDTRKIVLTDEMETLERMIASIDKTRSLPSNA